MSFWGFQVIEIAKNGQEAVEKFKSFSEKPDIILMDHRMPIKSGIDATKEIISLGKNPKIIFASADKTVREEALSIGAVDFFEKPFDFEKLADKINEVLKK